MSEQAEIKWSAVRIGAWLDMPSTTVKEVALKFDISGKGGFDMMRMAPAAVKYYREMSEKASRQKVIHQERQAKADADRAEMDVEEKLGNLVDRKDAMFVIADTLTQIRKIVERAPYLNPTQREKLGKAFCNVRIAEIAVES